MTTIKKLTSGSGHAIEKDVDRFLHRLADRLLIEHAHEFGLDRLLDFLGHEPNGIVERQARFDAAHDRFDSVGKLVEKPALIFLAPVADEHVGQHIAPATAKTGANRNGT